MGPGMMGGYGPGYGPGYGMGPGMMGGYVPYGMGMMGAWVGLNLSDAQTAQLEKIRNTFLEKQHKLMGQIWEEQAKLATLYSAEKRDPAAIGKAFDKLARLHREAMEAHIEAENKAADVLTKEQKEQLRRGFGRGMMGY
ncbi:MAG: Spy/CpxP family protein refolding chaperone [Rubrivivax sp.]|nr:Spy/CpxP family protein refolding chaperone [Rubrivivax sp.]